MLIYETVQSRKVIFVVNDLSFRIFVGGKLNKILSFLLTKLDTRSLEMSFHFFNFNVTFAFGVEKSESSKDCFRIIRLKLLVFQN